MPILADVQNQMLVLPYARDRYGLRRFLVQSQTTPNKFYKLYERTLHQEFNCDCQAYEYHPNQDCKHIKAVREHLK